MNILFGQYDFRLEQQQDQVLIWDVVRRRMIRLTPEEWIRQHWIHYLIEEKHFPRSRMSVEKGIKLHGQQKRYDLVLYQKTGKPLMVVECKAPSVAISQKTFDQVARYNLTLKVPYLLVSNGSRHYCCHIDVQKKQYRIMRELPELS